MLTRDLEIEKTKSHDYKEQRDVAEADVVHLKTELAKVSKVRHTDRGNTQQY